MGLADLTAAAAENPKSKFLEKMRCRLAGMGAVHERMALFRIEKVNRSKARVPNAELEGMLYEPQGLVDVYQGVGSKDIPGWRGPIEVVNANHRHENKITAEWGPGTRMISLTEVLPHIAGIFYSEVSGGTLRVLMCLVGNRYNHYEVLGCVETKTRDKSSQGAKRWREILETIQDCARELGFVIRGAIIGQGVKKLPIVRSRPGAGVLGYWYTYYYNRVKCLVLPSHWPGQLDKVYQRYCSRSLFSFAPLMMLKPCPVLGTEKELQSIFPELHSRAIQPQS